MLESEIAVLLDPGVTPTDKIYEQLGADLPGRDAFGGDLVARGKAAFQNARGRLRKELCPHLQDPSIRALIESQQSSDLIALVAVIASIVGAISGFSLNASLVAVLVVRMGARNLCPDLKD